MLDTESCLLYLKIKKIISLTMKKGVFTAVFLFVLMLSVCGQTVVTMNRTGEVYTIPCIVNGEKTKMIFDTGASKVTLSLAFAEKLYREGKLQNSDFKGSGASLTASGHIVENVSVNIRCLTIAGLVLHNVDAIVLNSQSSPLLLGLSAIQRLGRVTLRGNKLILTNNKHVSISAVKIRDEVSTYMRSQDYRQAIKLLHELENNDSVNENDLFNLIECYVNMKDFNKSLACGNSWIALYGSSWGQHVSDVYYYLGVSYMELKDFHEADKRFAEAIRLVSTAPILSAPLDECLTLSQFYSQKACNYLMGKAYSLSVEAFDIAIQYRMRGLGFTMDDLTGGKIKDPSIGRWLYSVSQIYVVFEHNEGAAERYVLLSAVCGYPDALTCCENIPKLKYMLDANKKCINEK